MKSKTARLLIVFVVALTAAVFTEPAVAESVTYNFTGTITSVSGTPFGLSPTVGQPVQGSFSYDTSQPPAYDTGTVAGYIQAPPSGMSVVISGVTLQSQDYNSFQVVNDDYGADNINGFFTPISVDGVPRSGWSSMSFSLSDFTFTALSSTALPTSLDFWSFSQRVGTLYDADNGGSVSFSIDPPGPPPPPYVWFNFYPTDPSLFDTIWFSDSSWDPAGVGIASQAWDFGDGATGEGCCPTHRYAADGDYNVQLTVTTPDGRTGSASQVVAVRTHDVAITRFTAPQSASAGQTRSVVVYVKNTRYPEQVTVDLYKSAAGGDWQWVGSQSQFVPVRPGGRTQAFSFNYTFTADDARLGKVTFKAYAYLQDARDALPADNEAIALPTKVNR